MGQIFILDDPELSQMVNGYRLRNGVAELERVASSNAPQFIRDLDFPPLIRKHTNVAVTQFKFLPRELSGVLSNIRMNLIQRLNGMRERILRAESDVTMPIDKHKVFVVHGFGTR